MPMKHGAKLTAAYKSRSGAVSGAKGFFPKIGALGRKASHTKTTAQLARSGKVRSAAVAAGVVGTTALSSRRGSGTGRSTGGRPTGMYRY